MESHEVFAQRTLHWSSKQLVVRVTVEQRHPNAYWFEPGDRTGFPLIVQQTLPPGYHRRLCAHLESDRERKTAELAQKLRRQRRADRREAGPASD